MLETEPSHLSSERQDQRQLFLAPAPTTLPTTLTAKGPSAKSCCDKGTIFRWREPRQRHASTIGFGVVTITQPSTYRQFPFEKRRALGYRPPCVWPKMKHVVSVMRKQGHRAGNRLASGLAPNAPATRASRTLNGRQRPGFQPASPEGLH